MTEQTIIKANILHDGQKFSEEKYLVVEKNKIVDITTKKQKADFEGFVTPAFIDPHSHIGMFRDGEPGQEAEGNDIISQFQPTNDPVNSIYFDDRAFKDAVDFGVLYSCVVPGSGNLIGGKAKVIRNFADNRKDAIIKDYGYKMALGYNPRSTGSWKGVRPNTRMGVYTLLENKFDDLKIKEEKASLTRDKKLRDLQTKQKDKEAKLAKKDYDLELNMINREYELTFTAEENALLDLLSGKKTAKIHVHKEDDVLYLIELVKKYNLKATADHTCDVWHKEIYNELAKNNIPVIFGPLGGIGGKVELAHAYYQNAALLMKSKAEYGLMTDHPVVWSPSLRDSLKFFLIQGMSEEDALSLITYKNAKLLGMEKEIGIVKKNALASLIVWDKNPLNLGAFPTMVMAEGKVVRKK